MNTQETGVTKKQLKVGMVFLLVIIIAWTSHEKKNSVGSVEKRELPKGNGVVTNIWIDSFSRLDVLKEHDVKYLFVDIGELGEKWNSSNSEQVNRFVNLVEDYERKENYDFILLPYSEINSYRNNIESEEFKESFIQGYSDLSRKGFDGLLVDIEPVRMEQRESFLSLLSGLRENFSDEKIIAVYAGHIVNKQGNNIWEWDKYFYREVAAFADIISAPGYDTDSDSKEEYKNHIRDQIKLISSINEVNFLFAIPTHKSQPETSQNALEAYSEEIAKHENNNIIGITVFAEWTATKSDWNNLNKYLGVSK